MSLIYLIQLKTNDVTIFILVLNENDRQMFIHTLSGERLPFEPPNPKFFISISKSLKRVYL